MVNHKSSIINRKSQYIPFKGDKFRAFDKEGGGEFFAGKFGDLTCTGSTKQHVFAAPEKGTPYAGKPILKLSIDRWRFWPAEKFHENKGRILED